MDIKFSVRGLDEVRRFLAELGKRAKLIAERAVAEYLVGNQAHGLKHYVPYEYVSIEQVGGFVSDAQRRFVMAGIREGSIDPGVPHRTGEMQRGWTFEQTGPFYTISNAVDYTGYVMGDGAQTPMHARQGWRTVSEVIKNNLQGAFRHAIAKIKEWIAANRP